MRKAGGTSTKKIRADGVEWRNREGKLHREDLENPRRRMGGWPQGIVSPRQELTEAEFNALCEKELAKLGDSFNAGLPRKIAVPRLLRTGKRARQKPT